MKLRLIALAMTVFCAATELSAQTTLPLTDALTIAVQQYEKIKAKTANQKAAEQNIQFQKDQWLPDLTLAAQQSFGTINVQNGPLYAYGGLGAASTSMPLPEQNWNAAFGSLYLANVNWNVFTFGRVKNAIGVAKADHEITKADVQQEIFQQQVKVTAAYFNVLAAQRVKYVQEKNLDRAKVFLRTTDALVKAGLLPGVNASLAKAEVSNAQSSQLKAYDRELEYAKVLAVAMGVEFQAFRLDSVFHRRLPALYEQGTNDQFLKHPSLLLQTNKIDRSNEELKLIRSQALPNFSLFGVLQGRGSGFASNYVQDNEAYSKSYLKGVGINRGNYLLGINLSWNITNLRRYQSKIKSQSFLIQSQQHDYNLIQQELTAQAALAEEKIKTAVQNYAETQTQLKAATDAFNQTNALYNNGLTTIVDWTQALYTLNRAEVEYEIAQNNVWQALLLKAAAHGDIQIILNAIQ